MYHNYHYFYSIVQNSPKVNDTFTKALQMPLAQKLTSLAG